jgi:alkanesulfonate monooxygenase
MLKNKPCISFLEGTMSLRFHWSLSSAGEQRRGSKERRLQSGLPDLDALRQYCEMAEECGIESLLTAFGFHRPDPIVLASAIGMVTKKIKFMVAVRSGICSPVSFVQQVNSVSAFINGRICLNVVAGHTPAEQRSYGDFLQHDERYQRSDEFLAVCRAFWQNQSPVNFKGKYYEIENGTLNTLFVGGERGAPEIFIGGNSSQAEQLAVKHGDCLWRLPEAPSELAPRVEKLRGQGIEIGLLVSIIARPSHDEAIDAAHSLVADLGHVPRKVHADFAKRSDSVAFTSVIKMADSGPEWITPYLWSGAVPYMGAPAIALVGSAEEIASAIMDYKRIGITQFLFMGWPDLEEMAFFSKSVLPLVRQKEQAETAERVEPAPMPSEYARP